MSNFWGQSGEQAQNSSKINVFSIKMSYFWGLYGEQAQKSSKINDFSKKMSTKIYDFSMTMSYFEASNKNEVFLVALRRKGFDRYEFESRARIAIRQKIKAVGALRNRHERSVKLTRSRASKQQNSQREQDLKHSLASTIACICES